MPRMMSVAGRQLPLVAFKSGGKFALARIALDIPPVVWTLSSEEMLEPTAGPEA